MIFIQMNAGYQTDTEHIQKASVWTRFVCDIRLAIAKLSVSQNGAFAILRMFFSSQKVDAGNGYFFQMTL